MKEESAALQVLLYAMHTERLGHRFYTRAAEMTDDERGRNMLYSIASDEEEHLSILQQEFDALKATGYWVALEKAQGYKQPSSPPYLFPEEEARVEEMISKRTSDLDALDIAMDLERRGYELYQKEAEETSDLTAKSVYNYLAKEENKHFTLLQNTRNYLASSGTWLWDDMHPPMLDGA